MEGPEEDEEDSDQMEAALEENRAKIEGRLVLGVVDMVILDGGRRELDFV